MYCCSKLSGCLLGLICAIKDRTDCFFQAQDSSSQQLAQNPSTALVNEDDPKYPLKNRTWKVSGVSLSTMPATFTKEDTDDRDTVK